MNSALTFALLLVVASAAFAQPHKRQIDTDQIIAKGNEVIQNANEKLQDVIAQTKEVIGQLRTRAEELLNKIKADKGNYFKNKLRKISAAFIEFTAKSLEFMLNSIRRAQGPIQEKIAQLQGALQKAIDYLRANEETNEATDEAENFLYIPDGMTTEEIQNMAKEKYEELKKKAIELIGMIRAESEKIYDDIRINKAEKVKNAFRKIRAQLYAATAATFEGMLKAIEVNRSAVIKKVQQLEGFINKGIAWFESKIEDEQAEQDEAETPRMKRDILPDSIRDTVSSKVNDQLTKLVEKCKGLIEKMRAKKDQVIETLRAETNPFARKWHEFRMNFWEATAKTSEKILEKITANEEEISEKIQQLEALVAKAISWVFKKPETDAETFALLPDTIRDTVVGTVHEKYDMLINKARELLDRMAEIRDAAVESAQDTSVSFVVQKARELKANALSMAMDSCVSVLDKLMQTPGDIEERVRNLETYLESAISWFFSNSKLE